jgi:hypothetical protein
MAVPSAVYAGSIPAIHKDLRSIRSLNVTRLISMFTLEVQLS